MELSYRQLEATLAAYLGVHPDRLGTFRSRLKQLQRLEFPAGVNIGRGTRMNYGTEHLLQLAVAFELIGTGMPAKTATQTVLQYWPRFEAAFGRVHRASANKEGGETFVSIVGRPLLDGDKFPDECVTVQDDQTLMEDIVGRMATTARAGVILVRADQLFQRINRLAEEVGQVPCAVWGNPDYERWSKSREQTRRWWDFAAVAAGR